MAILEAAAANRLSNVEDWWRAAHLAAGIGDHASFERLSRICSLRFSSTVEGSAALRIVFGLVQQPMDDRSLALARGLMDRANDGSIGSNLEIDSAYAFLAYREHRYPEALVLLDRFLATSGSRLGRQIFAEPALQATYIFSRALLNAELERPDEARRDFARARAQLKQALGDKPGHDRGDYYVQTYVAEMRQREAEALFQAKGIPLPEPDAR